ncbi:hypothetical protein [Nocardia carnea]|uniref:hypothetical protein n=1 Tax=Nocardia carnea TaxID=37328 RepID=UPI000524A55C|nr:hypothetical protein [Nocardia carnea]
MFSSSALRRTALFASSAVAAAVVTGCVDPDTAGKLTETSTPATTTVSAEPTISTESPIPSGAPVVGTARMEVRGGTGPATIRYSINGAAEQVETAVMLPWTKEYPVYDRVSSYVSAEGASMCTIIMDGNKYVAFQNEPDPTCDFAHWD